MNIGDLVTWKSDILNDTMPLEYGVVIGEHKAYRRMDRHIWVKFINGDHSHKARTLCNINHLVLVEDIKPKRT